MHARRVLGPLISLTMTVPRLRRAVQGQSPDLSIERSLWDQDLGYVVGMDEVGRGAWAGPIAVGAAVIPADRRIYKVRDSKMLTETEREAIFDRLADWCVSWAVGFASPAECDDLGMSQAQRLAARRALERLTVSAEAVLVDGNWDFVGGAHKIVGGDRSSLSIASASILAKVTRDRMMREMSGDFPAYNFEANKGYPCPVHKAALQGWGPSVVHRRSWAFMDRLIWRSDRSRQLAFAT